MQKEQNKVMKLKKYEYLYMELFNAGSRMYIIMIDRFT